MIYSKLIENARSAIPTEEATSCFTCLDDDEMREFEQQQQQEEILDRIKYAGKRYRNYCSSSNQAVKKGEVP